MNGIARIAITIISQSRCLRSNFIIAEKIVAAAVLSANLQAPTSGRRDARVMNAMSEQRFAERIDYSSQAIS
jgi:hypothetical protein